MSTLGVLYTCDLCGIKDAEVQVPFREQEDVVQWLEGKALTAIKADHATRSPWCRPTHLTQVKIPVPPGTDKVGGPVVN